MKKNLFFSTFILATFIAFTFTSNAQSNNQINLFQGGVNSVLLSASNSEAYVEQLAASGTMNSYVTIQQSGDLQYIEVEQTNVNQGVTNTYQEASNNTMNIVQLDGANLVLFGRQFTGSDNNIAVGQTGQNNGAAVAQVGNDNTALVGQSGSHNRTTPAPHLNAMHNAFLAQSNYDVSAYNPGGSGWTDGILQLGDENLATLAQSGDYNEGFIFQDGDHNNASIAQAGNHDSAAIFQRGTNNLAKTSQ